MGHVLESRLVPLKQSIPEQQQPFSESQQSINNLLLWTHRCCRRQTVGGQYMDLGKSHLSDEEERTKLSKTSPEGRPAAKSYQIGHCTVQCMFPNSYSDIKVMPDHHAHLRQELHVLAKHLQQHP